MLRMCRPREFGGRVRLSSLRARRRSTAPRSRRHAGQVPADLVARQGARSCAPRRACARRAPQRRLTTASPSARRRRRRGARQDPVFSLDFNSATGNLATCGADKEIKARRRSARQLRPASPASQAAQPAGRRAPQAASADASPRGARVAPRTAAVGGVSRGRWRAGGAPPGHAAGAHQNGELRALLARRRPAGLSGASAARAHATPPCAPRTRGGATHATLHAARRDVSSDGRPLRRRAPSACALSRRTKAR